jgi:hypothetical protein
MSLADLRKNTKQPKPTANGTESNPYSRISNYIEEDKFSSVQEKINKLTQNLEQCESETNGISKANYQSFVNENNSLVKAIEAELDRYDKFLFLKSRSNFVIFSIR